MRRIGDWFTFVAEKLCNYCGQGIGENSYVMMEECPEPAPLSVAVERGEGFWKLSQKCFSL